MKKYKLEFQCIGELKILQIILESFIDCKVNKDEVVNTIVQNLIQRLKEQRK